MGYLLSSLAHLPVDREVTLYIFVIDEGWKGVRGELLQQNFPEIAKSIGSHAVIAKGLSETWNEQVIQQLLGKNHKELSSLLPALLLTDKHPEELHADSMRLLVSLKDAEQRFEGIEVFFSALTQFARDRDPAFLKRFEKESVAVRALRAGNDIFQVKPAIPLFGVGINVNAAIAKFLPKSRTS